MKLIECSSSKLTDKLLSGISETAKIVGETYGPRGNNIILSDPSGVKITKDGITVLRNIAFEDAYEDIAAKILREASDQTNTQAGDGTTGTCILAEAIFKNGLKYIVSGGLNRTQVRSGISDASEYAVSKLKEMSKSISEKNEIWNVAYVSSNHSTEIADVLADIFDKIGPNGTISVNEGSGLKIESKIVEGMQFDQGYISPYFATNMKMEAELDDVYVLIFNKRISSIQDILAPLQRIMGVIQQDGGSILIIADDIDGDALSTIIYNRLRGVKICAVKSPSFGENRKNMMIDIAVLTNGQVVSDETGFEPEEIRLDNNVIGSAKKVIVTKDTCTIIGGNSDPEKLATRVEQLKNQIDTCTDSYDLDKYVKRLAKLTDGVGVISVGASTELELKEKKFLVDDAFCACKAAIAEGVVPGGGLALYKIGNIVADWVEKEYTATHTESEKIGAEIVAAACKAPIKRILENAGKTPEVVLSKLDELPGKMTGYDVLNEKFCDMYEAGIIDSTTAIVAEMQNASSVAGVLLTTTGVIVTKPDPKPMPPPMDMGLGGM